jgi:hypothetical protein
MLGARHSSGAFIVILSEAKDLMPVASEAKDLMPVASGDEVLRCAQDDRLG